MSHPISRRQMLKSSACGFGYLAMAGLAGAASNPLAGRAPHFTPRAKRVIFLFMQGGVSHVDSYDHKPRLVKDDGKMFSFDDARSIANSGVRTLSNHRVMKPLWKFAQRGQCGRKGPYKCAMAHGTLIPQVRHRTPRTRNRYLQVRQF